MQFVFTVVKEPVAVEWSAPSPSKPPKPKQPPWNPPANPKDLLEAVGAELANLMGWTVVENDSGWYGLEGPNGQGITLKGGNWAPPGMWHIHGRYPVSKSTNARRYCNNWGPDKYDKERLGLDDSINVSKKKSPWQIHRNVKNRLLPGYLKLYEWAKKRQDEFEESEAKQLALYERIASALGDTYGALKSHDGTIYLPGDGWGQVIASHYGAEVEFKLRNVPADVAVRIVELLKEG